MENSFTVWIDDLLCEVKKNPSSENIKLIESCGKACAVHRGDLEGIKQLKTAASNCRTRSDYLDFFKNTFPFEVSEIEDGIILALGKDECTCSMSPDIRNSALCYCTLGHEKAIWSEFFGKDVKIELLETILNGGNDCIVKIFI